MDAAFAKQSQKSVNDAVQSVKEELQKQGYSVLFELNFQDTLKKEGEEYSGNFVLLEVCDADKAKALLDKNIEAGYSLPCKIAVYEDRGHTCIGMVLLSSLYGLTGHTELDPVAKEIEASLKKVIEGAA